MKYKIGKKVVWLDPANETSHVTVIVQLKYVCSNGTTELECLEEELVSLENVYCCSECGCIDIQSEAWAYFNSKPKKKAEFKEFLDAGRNWCPNCEEIIESDEIISVEEYEKQQKQKTT
jgi:hypothetical protein